MRPSAQRSPASLLARTHALPCPYFGPHCASAAAPNQYNLGTPDVDSKHERAPGYSFSRSHRDVRVAYTQQQLRADPGATTFAETPAPYDVRGNLSSPKHQSAAPLFGTGPRSYSPTRERPHTKGPFISKCGWAAGHARIAVLLAASCTALLSVVPCSHSQPGIGRVHA